MYVNNNLYNAISFAYKYFERRIKMPETKTAREKILEYKELKGYSYQTLADMVSQGKQEVYDAVTGRRQTEKSHEILADLLKVFGL